MAYRSKFAEKLVIAHVSYSHPAVAILVPRALRFLWLRGRRNEGL